MKFTTNAQDPSIEDPGCSLQIDRMRADWGKLVALFGEPEQNIGDRVQVQWVIRFEDGEIATVYDWKENCEPEEVTRWNVGALNKMVAHRVYQIVTYGVAFH